MTNIEKIGEVVIPTLFIILPLFGVTLSLLKVMMRKTILSKRQRKGRSCGTANFFKLLLLWFLIFSGFFLVISTIIIFWFPNYPLPIYIRKAVIVFLLLYWVFFIALYGLNRAVTAGAGSATGILNNFFDTVLDSSKENHNK
ncbi:MAG: hypothetical protein WA081_09140 [Desulfosalsimonadaceae bacterium]